MAEGKTWFVKDIRPDDQFVSVFLCQTKNNFTGKTGQPYLSLSLVDKTGAVDGKVWDNAAAQSERFNEGDYVKVKATATTFNSRLQLRVGAITAVPEDTVDPSDFFPTSQFDIDDMMAELRAIVDDLENADIKRLLVAFLDDPEFAQRFRLAPAARSIHHNFLGGLLEHTLSLAKLGVLLSGHYPQVDRSMLIAGVMLHDIGKTRELSYDRSAGYTDEGRLVGHITLGVEMLNAKIAELGDFPAELKMLITHMILSHHGVLEYGSPKRPKIVEAMVLSMMDDLDARVFSFQTILEQETQNTRWSSFQRIYDRFLYRWQGADDLTATEKAEPQGQAAVVPDHRPTEKPRSTEGFSNQIHLSNENSGQNQSKKTETANLDLPLGKGRR